MQQKKENSHKNSQLRAMKSKNAYDKKNFLKNSQPPLPPKKHSHKHRVEILSH